MEKLTCVRCGHKWYQRTPQKPARCAGCKAFYWDRPARVAKIRVVGKMGAHSIYPFHDLEIGKGCLIAWPMTPDGKHVDSRRCSSIHSSLSAHARRTGKKFNKECAGRGISITRIA